MTDKHCSAARFYDPGDYVGRHRLSKKWGVKVVVTPRLVIYRFKINLRGGAFR